MQQIHKLTIQTEIKKFTPHIAIGFISFCLVILILTQLIWIQKAIALRADNFKQNVQKSLQEVVTQLAIQENFETLLKSAKATNKKNIVLQNEENAQISTEKNKINEEISFENNNFSLDYNTENNQNRAYSTDTTRYILEQIFADSSVTQDKKFLSKFFEETQKSRKKSVGERINYLQLDSLIYNALQQNGILDTYTYEIVPSNRSFIATIDRLNKQNENESVLYAVQLFPNDYLSTYHYLVLKFENEQLYFSNKGISLLLLALFSLILVGGGTYYLFDTTRKQQQLAEIKNDFINNMTHELKTPIATIALASEAMVTNVSSFTEKNITRFSKIIFDENQRLKQNVERMLETAKMERGGIELSYEVVDMQLVVETVLVQLEIQLKAKKTTVKTDFKAMNTLVKGDKMHLTNLIFNLIDNAIKYCKNDLMLQISTQNKSKNLVIEIKDNGIGMTNTQQERVFEKFYRVHTGDVHNIKGFGIGLSYCKSVVEKHKGVISLTSQPNKGTTFKIELPVIKKENKTNS